MTTIARWAVLAPLFLIPFLALYVADSLFFPFISGKHFVFRILVETAFVGWIVLAIADRRYRPQWSWVLGSFGLFVAWMLIADLMAPNAHKAIWSNFERMEGWITLIHVFLLFLIAGTVLTTDKLWRKWWLTFIAATALVCGYGLLQLFGLAQIHQSDTRLDATLGNSEYLAGYLLLAIGITLWQAFKTQREKKWLRNSLFALVALEVLILFGTGTRGTALAFVAAAVFGGLLWAFESGKRGRKSAAIFLAGLVFIVGGFHAIRDTSFIQGDPNLSRIANISVSDLDTRFIIWGMAIEGIKERPVVGWGQEGFNYVFNSYYTPSMHGQEPWFDRAHNVYLDWTIAGGIPALLLFLLLGWSAAFAVYRARELEPWERVLILSALAAYAIQGLAVFDNLFTYVPMALLLAYAHSMRARPLERIQRLPEARGATLEVIVAPVALIVAFLLIYMVNIPTYAAGKDLIRGISPQGSAEQRLGYFKSALDRDPFATQEIREQLLQFAQGVEGSAEVSNSTKQEAMSYAAAQIEMEIARAPEDARLRILYASFLRNIGQFEEARTQSAAARTLSPQKQTIIIEQGIGAWQAGDMEAARDFFAEAYALAPESDEFAAYAAAGRIVTGDTRGAKELLQEHFGTTTPNHMVLAVAYQEIGAWSDLVDFMRARAAVEQTATSGYQLAAALAQAGRLAEARAQVRAVMAEYPESTAEGSALLMQLGVR